jgi:hypothetical protein
MSQTAQHAIALISASPISRILDDCRAFTSVTEGLEFYCANT